MLEFDFEVKVVRLKGNNYGCIDPSGMVAPIHSQEIVQKCAKPD